jgi:hypothetical protein
MSKFKLFFICIALVSLVMISCHKERNKLINSWKITAVEAKTPISDSIKNEFLSKGELTFTELGSVTGFLGRDLEQGSYILTNKGKNLVIKDETGTPYPFESVITDDQLILEGPQLKLTFEKK